MKGPDENQSKFSPEVIESRPQTQDRREFLGQLGGLTLCSLVSGIGLFSPGTVVAGHTSRAREINIGTFGPSHCSTPFVYTKLSGLFDQERLNVNLINYPAMPLIANDLISGKIDFGQLIVPLVFAIHTGSPPFQKATPMVIPQITGTNGAALITRKGTHIKKPDDFKGKMMANHSKLSVHYLLNMMFLESHGLNYTRDVRFQVVDLDNIVEEMKKGAIDTFVMPEPKNAIIEEKGIGDVYMLSKYLWPNHPCCSLVTRRDFFEKNRDLVADVAGTMTRGAFFANNASHREQTIQLLQSSPHYNFGNVPREVLLKAFTPGRSDFYPFPYQSTALVLIEIMKRYALLPADTNDRQLAADVFLSDFSRSLIKEAGEIPPGTNYRPEKILGSLKVYA